MTKDEALKLALEALEEAWYHVGTFQPTEKAIDLYDEARAAIKEALAQPEQEPVSFAKIFTQLKTDDEPCNEVIALGHMMRDWLQKQVSDNSSYVDTGKGFSEYNLWVMCEGKELLISIKESK
jgi:ATP-dependent Clp protease ATP-binding subunit ClpA